MESDEEDAVAKCGEDLKSKVILLSENQLKNAPVMILLIDLLFIYNI